MIRRGERPRTTGGRSVGCTGAAATRNRALMANSPSKRATPPGCADCRCTCSARSATLVVPRTATAVGVRLGHRARGRAPCPCSGWPAPSCPLTVRLVWLATTADELAEARALGLDAEPQARPARVLAHPARPGARRHPRLRRRQPLRDARRLRRAAVARHPAQEAAPRRRRSRRPRPRGSAAMIVRAWLPGGGPPDRPVPGRAVRPSCRASRAPSAPRASASRSPAIRATTCCCRAPPSTTGEPVRGRCSSRLVGPLPDDRPVVLYAPTWRDGEPDPAAPDDATWARHRRVARARDGVLVVRTHPLGARRLLRRPAQLGPGARCSTRPNSPTSPRRCRPSTRWSPTTRRSPTTSRSPAAPMVFLAPDVDIYLDARGLYEPYAGVHRRPARRELGPRADPARRAVQDDPDVVAAAKAERDRLRDEHFDHLDGRATERVLAPDPGARPGRPLAATSGVARPADRRGVAHQRRRIVAVGPRPRADMVSAASLDGPRGRIDGNARARRRITCARGSRCSRRAGARRTWRCRRATTASTSATSHRVADRYERCRDVQHPLFRATAHVRGRRAGGAHRPAARRRRARCGGAATAASSGVRPRRDSRTPSSSRASTAAPPPTTRSRSTGSLARRAARRAPLLERR